MRFMQLNPALQIELSFEDRYVNLVEQGIDVAIRMGPMADSTLGARYLGLNPWVVVASANYLARHGIPRQPADLAVHHALIYSTVQGDARWRESIRCLAAGPVRPVLVERGNDARCRRSRAACFGLRN
jgi:DNA-binding transcriptional LysR family regulator